MRTTGMFVGLALVLGLAMPAAAAPGMAQAASETVQAAPGMQPVDYDGTGAGGSRPGMRAQARPGGWQRGFGQGPGHPRPSLAGIVLMNQEQLGLTAQQVDSVRKLGMDFRRAAIRRGADLQLAQLDLLSLRMSDPVDMGKIEAKVREIEKLKGDGSIARIRTAEAVKTQLTADQREKLRSLWRAEWQRRGGGEGGADDAAAAEEGS